MIDVLQGNMKRQLWINGMIALGVVAVVTAACGSESDQAPADSGPLKTREWALERGPKQVSIDGPLDPPATPENAVARLMPWPVFKTWKESARGVWTREGYGEPEPDDSVWVVQMEARIFEGFPAKAEAFVFPIVVLDGYTGLSPFAILATEPLILPQDYYDPELRLGPLKYVVEPSRVSHEEAIALVLDQGPCLSRDTPLRGHPDFNRATADQIRFGSQGRFWRELQLEIPTDPKEDRLGWLLTLPYEMRLVKHAGASGADGTQPPRVTEWGNVIFAILDDETRSLVGGGTKHQWNAEMSQDEYSSIWDYGQNLGWWRLWDELRDLPEYERIPAELAARLAAEGGAVPEPTPTPLPSTQENTANFAADPLMLEAVVGRVTRRIGEVRVPDAGIPGFNIFSYWVIEPDEHFVGQTPVSEVIVIVHEGDANADRVQFRRARFPVTMNGSCVPQATPVRMASLEWSIGHVHTGDFDHAGGEWDATC
jgi:hypothetical protein